MENDEYTHEEGDWMIFHKTLTTEYIEEPLSFETLSKTYSLYKYSQDGDDPRGLISRTLTYHEYLIFCLKANPLSTYDKFHDWNKIDKSLQTLNNKIPQLEHREIEPLKVEKELHDKIYAFQVDYGLYFEKILLYDVFLISKTKTPHYLHANNEHYKHEQPTWLHPPVEEPPLTSTEEHLIKINHIMRSLTSDLKRIKEIEKYYETFNNTDKTVIRNMKRIETQLEEVRKGVKTL